MIYLITVSLVWAFSFGLIGNTLTGVDSFFVATVRLGLASLLFLPFLRVKSLTGLDGLRLLCYGYSIWLDVRILYECFSVLALAFGCSFLFSHRSTWL